MERRETVIGAVAPNIAFESNLLVFEYRACSSEDERDCTNHDTKDVIGIYGVRMEVFQVTKQGDASKS